MLRRRELMAKAKSELPPGYIRCKYLESNGKQFIDTGLYGGLDTFGVDCTVLGATTSRYYLLGNFNQTGQCGLMTIPSNTAVVSFTYYVGGNLNRIIIGQSGQVLRVTNKDRDIVSNGVSVGTMPANTMKLTNSKLMLFGTGISTPFNGSGKIYELKLFSDLSFAKMLRNYITAIDPSGKPCMYDTISKQTFCNAGTGEFGYELTDGTIVLPK